MAIINMQEEEQQQEFASEFESESGSEAEQVIVEQEIWLFRSTKIIYQKKVHATYSLQRWRKRWWYKEE